jgi:DNA-binding IclR family transcriptional regulator
LSPAVQAVENRKKVRAGQTTDTACARAMMVHAKDERAQRFYEHLGFEQFPGKPLALYRLLKDIRAMRRI